MRFYVKCAFPHLGKRGAVSRKSAFCVWPLTEKRTLYVGSHGKAHSACGPSRKDAFWEAGVTEKRILVVPPHGKAHSVRRISRKSALCMRTVAQNASLRHGGTAWGSECAFPSRHGHRMRLCVSVWGQNALFRKLRFSSPGQTWRHLTEKRILQPAGHGKAHSACGPSRKSALCVRASPKDAPYRRAVAHSASTRTRNHATPDSPYPKPYDLKFTLESESFRITSCAPPSTSDVDETSVILAFLRSS